MDGIDLALGKPKVPHFLLHNQYCWSVNYNPGCDEAAWTTVYSARSQRPGDLCEAAAGWDSRRGSAGGREAPHPEGTGSNHHRISQMDGNALAGWAELQTDLIAQGLRLLKTASPSLSQPAGPGGGRRYCLNTAVC